MPRSTLRSISPMTANHQSRKPNNIDFEFNSVPSTNKQNTFSSMSNPNSYNNEKLKYLSLNDQQQQFHTELQRVWDEVKQSKSYNEQLESQLQKLLKQSNEGKSYQHHNLSTSDSQYEVELNRIQNALKQQEEIYVQREQKYKEKLKEQKIRYKRKLGEYQEYTQNVKKNYEKVLEQNVSLKSQVVSKQQNKLSNEGELLMLEMAHIYNLDKNSQELCKQVLQQTYEQVNQIRHQDSQIDKLNQLNDDLRVSIKVLEQSLDYQKKINIEQQNQHQQLSARQQYNSNNKSNNHSTTPNYTQKTIEISQRFDKLKQEIQRVKSEGKGHPLTKQDEMITQDRLKLIEEKERDLWERERRIAEAEVENRNTLRSSLIQIDRDHQDKLTQSVDKERNEWQEKSLITSSELYKFQQMLENVSQKLEKKDQVAVNDIKRDISLTKMQIKKLQEFHNRLKEMSPISLRKQKGQRTNLQDSEERFQRIRGFKLGLAKDYPGVDSSSCFETLHELCNIQIEELKKTLRIMSDERDDIIQQLDEFKDSNQALTNEKMEIEVVLSQKVNEVTQLHKYLEDYEKNIRALKQIHETKLNSMNSEIQLLFKKLDKQKEKKSQLQQRLDSKDNSSYYQGLLHSNNGNNNQNLSNSNNDGKSLKEENDQQRQINDNQVEKIKVLQDIVHGNMKPSSSQQHITISQTPNNHIGSHTLDEEHQFQLLLNNQSPSPFKVNSQSQQYLQMPQNLQKAHMFNQIQRISGTDHISSFDPHPISSSQGFTEQALEEDEEEMYAQHIISPPSSIYKKRDLLIKINDQQEQQNHQQAESKNHNLASFDSGEDDEDLDEEDDQSSHQQRNRSESEQHLERQIDDVRKIIRYEEYQYQNSSNVNNGNSQTSNFMETNTPVLTPQGEMDAMQFQFQQTQLHNNVATTRSQRIAQKHNKDQVNKADQAMTGKSGPTFTFVSPQNYQDEDNESSLVRSTSRVASYHSAKAAFFIQKPVRTYYPDNVLMKRNEGDYYADPIVVAERVVRLIALHDNVKDPSAITISSSFNSLGLNDLDCQEIYLQAEREFDLEISEEDCESFSTVNDLVEFLARNFYTKA